MNRTKFSNRAFSPATLLHEVTIIDEQTRIQWCASRAAIENGRIVVAGSRAKGPPTGMLERTGATFTITAADGGDRIRRFPNVIYEQASSRPPQRYVFD